MKQPCRTNLVIIIGLGLINKDKEEELFFQQLKLSNNIMFSPTNKVRH